MSKNKNEHFTIGIVDADNGLEALVTVSYPANHGLFGVRALIEASENVDDVLSKLVDEKDPSVLDFLEKRGITRDD